MKHTPTPWVIDTSTGVITIKATIGIDEQLQAPISKTIALLPMTETNEANAKRIVDCVNALDGIELPTDGILSKENAHIYIRRQVAVYSDITSRWRLYKLDTFGYSEFMRGSSDFAKLSVITHNQIPVSYGK